MAPPGERVRYTCQWRLCAAQMRLFPLIRLETQMSGDIQCEQLLARAEASASLLARADDHTASAEALASLAWCGAEGLDRAVAANPNTPSAMLLSLLARCPAAVLVNPILPLLPAENSAWVQQAARRPSAALSAARLSERTGMWSQGAG